jgi:general secretion pathway protein K
MMYKRQKPEISNQKIRNRSSAQLSRGSQEGSALIVTLLLVTILVALVVNFVYDVHIDMSTVSNWSYAQKASFIARSGQNLSTRYISELNKESYSSERVAELPIERDLGSNVDLSVTVEDENAKLNINSIIYPNGKTNEKHLVSLQKLIEYLNINPDLALIIADWIDPDSEPRLSDSENSAKNEFLWSLDELRLVDGMNNKIFDKLSPYITIFGNAQVNINTADLPVLASLSRDMNEEFAQRIIYYRENSPFENKNHIVRVSGMEAIGIKILDRIGVSASHLRVTSRATVNDITRVIESVIDTSSEIHFWREG